MTSETSPYIGPRPFEAEDQKRFFGRDRESNELLSMIFAHPVLLLYAQSGAGKTSLLNAKLIPMLHEEEFEIYPPARLRVAIPARLNLDRLKYPYTFCTLLNWAAEFGTAPAQKQPVIRASQTFESLAKMTLANYIDTHPLTTLGDYITNYITKHLDHYITEYPGVTLAGYIAEKPRKTLGAYIAKHRPNILADFITEHLNTDMQEHMASYVADKPQATLADYKAAYAARHLSQAAQTQYTIDYIAGYLEGYATTHPNATLDNFMEADLTAIDENNNNIADYLDDNVKRHMAEYGTEHPQAPLTGYIADYKANPPPPDAEDPMPRVLIFDQFEELFTAYPEHWQHREEFIRQITEVVEANPSIRVLLVIREDFLAQLDPFAPLLPERLQARFRMERLQSSTARLAIEGPLNLTDRAYDKGVAQIMVDELMRTRVQDPQGNVVDVIGQYVEPVQLQVVCSSIWSNLPPEARLITQEHLRTFGDVDNALQDFYERVIENTLKQSPAAEDQLRDWCENVLITGLGTRNTVYRGQHSTGGIANAVIDALDSQHLIRAERRAGARWYELTHDRLIEPIRSSNRAWNEAQREKRTQMLKQRLLSAVGALVIIFISVLIALLILKPLDIISQRDINATNDAATMAMVALEGTITQDAISLQSTLTQVAAVTATAQVATATAEAEAAAVAIAEAQQEALLLTGIEQALNANDSGLALALAWEAVRQDDTPSPELQAVLLEAAYAPGVRRRFDGHSGIVWAVAVAPSDKLILSGSEDGDLIVWDAENGQIHQQFTYDTAVWAAAFSPDGQYVLAGTADGSIYLCDIESGETLQPFIGHNAIVTSVAFSPDNDHMLSGSADGTLRLWDLATGEQVQQKNYGSPIYSVDFSADGSLALFGARDGRVILWDVTNWRENDRLEGHSDAVRAVAFNSDDTQALSGSRDGNAILWDIGRGAEIRKLDYGTAVWSAAFSPDDRYLLMGLDDNSLRLWDVNSRTETLQLNGHAGAVRSVAFSSDGFSVVSGSADQSVQLWDIETGAIAQHFRHNNTLVSAVALNADGTRALSGTGDGTVRLWDVETGEELRTMQGYDARIVSLVINDDGTEALSVTENGALILWNLETGQSSYSWRFGLFNATWSVSFTPNGPRGLSAPIDSTSLILWDVAVDNQDDSPLKNFDGHEASVTSIAFDPKGEHSISGDETGIMILWNVARGTEISRLVPNIGAATYESAILSIAFSPDGQYVLAGTENGSLIFWDLETGVSVVNLTNTGEILSVAFGSGGRVASGSWSGVLNLWTNMASSQDTLSTVANGNVPGFPTEFNVRSRIYSLAFNPSAPYVLSGSTDGVMRLWQIETSFDDLVAWIQANRCVRQLSDEERLSYRLFTIDLLSPGPGETVGKSFDIAGTTSPSLAGETLLVELSLPDGRVLDSESVFVMRYATDQSGSFRADITHGGVTTLTDAIITVSYDAGNLFNAYDQLAVQLVPDDPSE